MKTILFFTLLTFVFLISKAQIPSFLPSTNYVLSATSPTNNPNHLTSADFNHDGNMDLAIAHLSSSVSILLGSGVGTFSTPANFNAGSTAANGFDIVSADFNHDGNMDVATAGGYVNVRLGNGLGGLAPATSYIAAALGNAMYPQCLTTADFNFDGILDIATGNASIFPSMPGTVSIMLGIGTGGFSTPTTLFTIGEDPKAITCGDWNGDGNMDVMTGNFLSNNISIVLGDGLGGASPTPITISSAYVLDLLSGDFNGDNHLDLAATDGDAVQVILGNGLGGYAPPTYFSFGFIAYSWGFTKGDFNGDGKIDLAAASTDGFTSQLSILSGNGLGGFSIPTFFSYTGGLDAWNITAENFNADNKNDIAIINYSSNNVTVFMNNNCNSTYQYSDTICQGSTYSFFGSTYTASASTVHTHTIPNGNSQGCDSNIVLNLIVSNACGTAPTQVIMSIENTIQTSCNEFQFDVFITNNGTTALDLKAYQFGIKHASGLANGGTISATFISRDPVLSTLNPLFVGYISAGTAGGGPLGSAVVDHIYAITNFGIVVNPVSMPFGMPIRLATIKISTTTSWPTSFQPNLLLQDYYALGYYQCIANCIVTPPGANFSVAGIGNTVNPNIIQGLSVVNQNNNFVLSPPCNNTAAISNISACNSYTWPINGITYTSSGIYTHTNIINSFCNPCIQTDSLLLNISFPTSSSQSVTACNSFTWPVNGISYSVGGTYTHTYINASGCVHQDTLLLIMNCSSTLDLSLKCFIHGFWDGIGGMVPVLANQSQTSTINACDSIDVELRDQGPPYLLISSTRTVLPQDGIASCTFPGMGAGGNYYIVIKHRNALQTWSSNPINFSSTSLSTYDFTTSANQAYGSNQIQVAPGVYAFYSGDVLIDENIDLLDLVDIEADINSFLYGYYSTDINGDGNVDLLDGTSAEGTISSFVFSIHP